MSPHIQSLLRDLAEGRKPDIHDLASWLVRQEIDYDEWAAVAEGLCKAYGLRDEAELAEYIKKPVFLKQSTYVDDFLPLLKDIGLTGWLADYVNHTCELKAPPAFHFANGLAIISAALRRQVFIDQGYYQVWPAVQVMNVGPSGRTGKSTASEYAVHLALGEAGEAQSLFNLLPDEGSGEALKTELSQLSRKQGEATGLLYVSEMATFMGKQEYNATLIQTLTDLFDSRLEKRRRTGARGNERMKNIAVAAIFNTNEEWAIEAIPSSAFGGGFFGRLLPFYQHDTDRGSARPKPPFPPTELVAGLTRLRFIKGPAVLTAEAETWYDARYKELERGWPEDERLLPFWERVSVHLLRVGMLLSISQNLGQRDSVRIEAANLEQADGVLRWILRYLPRLYSFLGVTAFGAEHARIFRAIQRKGGTISDGDLGRLMSRRMPRRALEEHLGDMIKNGLVERVKLAPWEGKYGWKLLRKMEDLS